MLNGHYINTKIISFVVRYRSNNEYFRLAIKDIEDKIKCLQKMEQNENNILLLSFFNILKAEFNKIEFYPEYEQSETKEINPSDIPVLDLPEGDYFEEMKKKRKNKTKDAKKKKQKK